MFQRSRLIFSGPVDYWWLVPIMPSKIEYIIKEGPMLPSKFGVQRFHYVGIPFIY